MAGAAPRIRRWGWWPALGLLLSPATSLSGQQGQVAGSSVGEAGQRLVRGQAVAGRQPLARVNSRIQNRIQSRVRTRIDRTYDPSVTASSAITQAGDQARSAIGRDQR